MWPGIIPDIYQKLPESDSGSFRYTRSRDYQTPTRHALLGSGSCWKTYLKYSTVWQYWNLKASHHFENVATTMAGSSPPPSPLLSDMPHSSTLRILKWFIVTIKRHPVISPMLSVTSPLPRSRCEVLQSACLSVCLSVCLSLSSHIPEITSAHFTRFSVHITGDLGSVLVWRQWNTLCPSGFVDDIMSFPIAGPTARGVGNINVSAVLKQVAKISNVFARGRHAVWLCRRIQWLQTANPGAQSDVYTL